MSLEPLRFRRVRPDLTHNKRVTSYGLVVRSKEGKVLLVRRRYTPSYLNLMRGTYRVAHLSLLISGLSREEADNFVRLLRGEVTFTEHFLSVFSAWFPNCQDMLVIALERFESALPFLRVYFSLLRIEKLPLRPEWLFPKGKQRFREPPEQCAKRECLEETGVDVGSQPLTPLNSPEITVSERGRIYETQHFQCIVTEGPLGPCTEMEIGEKKWATIEEASELLTSQRFQLLASFRSLQ